MPLGRRGVVASSSRLLFNMRVKEIARLRGTAGIPSV